MDYIQQCFKENKPFSVVDYFKGCRIDDRILAEKEFKRNIIEISNWNVNEKSKNMVSFCLKTIKNNYDVCSAKQIYLLW